MTGQPPHLPNWVYPGEVRADGGQARVLVVGFSDLVTPAQAKRAATVAALLLRGAGVRDVRVVGPATIVGRNVVLELTGNIDAEAHQQVRSGMSDGYQTGLGSALLEGPPAGGEIVAVYRGW